MNQTIITNFQRIDDNTFSFVALHGGGTSYSKSLYPTITKSFKKYADTFYNGGQWNEIITDIEMPKETGIYAKLITFKR